eukprot:5464089-Alexandrium_andersonii.AAC.1
MHPSGAWRRAHVGQARQEGAAAVRGARVERFATCMRGALGHAECAWVHAPRSRTEHDPDP